MAKPKLAGRKSGRTVSPATASKAADIRGALPCAIIVIGGMILVSLLFFASLKSAAN
jgi:hypothetical protein